MRGVQSVIHEGNAPVSRRTLGRGALVARFWFGQHTRPLAPLLQSPRELNAGAHILCGCIGTEIPVGVAQEIKELRIPLDVPARLIRLIALRRVGSGTLPGLGYVISVLRSFGKTGNHLPAAAAGHRGDNLFVLRQAHV